MAKVARARVSHKLRHNKLIATLEDGRTVLVDPSDHHHVMGGEKVPRFNGRQRREPTVGEKLVVVTKLNAADRLVAERWCLETDWEKAIRASVETSADQTSPQQ